MSKEEYEQFIAELKKDQREELERERFIFNPGNLKIEFKNVPVGTIFGYGSRLYKKKTNEYELIPDLHGGFERRFKSSDIVIVES